MKLAPESIQAARQWFADNALACIRDVQSGAVRVNDPASYFEDQRRRHADALAGRFDHSLTFLQLAHYFQTGECPPLLP